MIPDSVISIGNSAFINAGVSNVTLGVSLRTIGASAFYGGSFYYLKIPDSVTSIGEGAFSYCYNLTNAIIGIGVTSIGNSVFEYCGCLVKVVIPNTVTNIGPSAFAECELNTLTIPNSVVSIEDAAFYYCRALATVYFQGNAPILNSFSFYGDNVTLYYLPGTSGWGPLGVSGILWNPQVQTGDGSFGVRTNQFGFNITGTTNIPIVVEVCTNLGSTWVPLQTLSLTNGSVYFSDPQWTNSPGRFYRIGSP